MGALLALIRVIWQDFIRSENLDQVWLRFGQNDRVDQVDHFIRCGDIRLDYVRASDFHHPFEHIQLKSVSQRIN